MTESEARAAGFHFIARQNDGVLFYQKPSGELIRVAPDFSLTPGVVPVERPNAPLVRADIHPCLGSFPAWEGAPPDPAERPDTVSIQAPNEALYSFGPAPFVCNTPMYDQTGEHPPARAGSVEFEDDLSSDIKPAEFKKLNFELVFEKDGKKARIGEKDGLIVYEGDMPIADSAKLFFEYVRRLQTIDRASEQLASQGVPQERLGEWGEDWIEPRD